MKQERNWKRSFAGLQIVYLAPAKALYAESAKGVSVSFAKARKHSRKQIRKAIRKQICYVRRDLKYLDQYMSDGYAPVEEEIPLLLTIMKLYEQQLYMYEARTHSVEKRIVSIRQP